MNYKPFLAIFLCMAILMMGSVSAFGERASIQPDLKSELINDGLKISPSADLYPAISIVDNWDLPLISKEKASLVLTSHDASCGIDCMSEFQIATYTDSALVDDVKFFTLIDDGIVLDEPREQAIRSYQFQYYGDIENYTTQCEILTDAKNGSKYTHCVQIKVGSYKGWIDYNVGDVLPAGTYDVKLLGEKRPTRSVDWIIKTQGKTIDEWATWGNISTGSQAEVILNSPTDGSTQYIRNVSTTATANITGGAYLVNATLFDNSTGSWGARNSTNCLTSSYSDNIVSIQAWSDLGSKTEKMGMKFTTLYATTLINVTKYSSHAATKAYLWDASKNQIGSAVSFSGDVAVFPNILLNASTTYYIVTDNSGVGYTAYGTGGETYPKVATLINYTSSYFGGVDDTNRWIAFSKITMNRSDIVKNKTQTFTNTYPVGSNILWNYQFCDSDGACGFAPNNYTFSIDSQAPSIALNYPTSLINYGAINGTLNLSITATDTNLASVWYNYNGTNVTIVGAISGVANLSNITLSDKKNVTIYANDTAGNLNTSVFSWDYTVFNTNVLFNNETISGFSNVFNIYLNSTLVNGLYFNYSNSITPSTFIYSDNVIISNNSVVSPSVAINTNISFNWIISLIDGTNISTKYYNQLVKPVNFSANCSSGFLFANMMLFDERTKQKINGSIATLFSIYNNNNLIVNFSGNASGTNYTLCTSLNLSNYSNVIYSAQFQYTSTDYALETYNIQNASYTGPQNISLFPIMSNQTTEFLVSYLNNKLVKVEGAVLQLIRKYLNTDTTEVVEAPLTSSLGTAILHIDSNSGELYQIVVVKNGIVLDIFPALAFKCDNILVGDCQYKLYGKLDAQNIISVETLQDFTYTTLQNNNSIEIIYSVPSGKTSKVNMQAIQTDSFGNTTQCNQTTYSSAGSITCAYNNTITDSILSVSIKKDDKQVDNTQYFIEQNGAQLFSSNNYFIVVILLLSVIGMAFSSPEWIIINSVVVLLISGSLWLLNGLNFVIGLGEIMWLIVAASILISKLSKQDDR